jgi:hypothetical protein
VATGGPAIGRSEAGLLVTGILASGTAADGFLMMLVGSGSFFPQAPPYAPIPLALVGIGLGVAVTCFALIGRRLVPVLASATPRLFPFAPLPLNAALYVLLVLGGVSIFHGFFDVFTSAHNGGTVSSITDQSDLSSLLIGASVVVWLLTLYAIVVMYRIFRIGRHLDARNRSVDVYGRPVTAPADVALPIRRAPAPPVPGRARSILVGTSVGLAVVISAAIQILEVDVSPAPPIDWLWAQLFSPFLSIPVAAGIAAIDRGLRDVERRYALAFATHSEAAAGPRPAD